MENIAVLGKKIINLCRIPAQINSQIFDAKHSEFYQFFVRKQDIGHPILDALEAAYQAASGPIKETIQYMLETVRTNLNSFRSF